MLLNNDDSQPELNFSLYLIWQQSRHHIFTMYYFFLQVTKRREETRDDVARVQEKARIYSAA